MLRVRTFVANSTVANAGLGLFAAEDIEEGALVWRFDPGFDLVVNEEDWPGDVPPDCLFHFGFMPEGQSSYILCLDNARYMNHSATPNLTDDENGSTIACRAIRQGEELFEDYHLFYNRQALLRMGFDPE